MSFSVGGKTLVALLVGFIVLDLGYSFVQHLNGTLDGDMPAIVVPGRWHTEVLKDPFGFGVLTEGKRYTGTNRFFAHWSESTYYKTVPLLLQVFVSPVESVYLATALFKTALQMLLVWLLAVYIAGTGRIRSREFLVAAALVLPLFQVSGFPETLWIIGPSVTYMFFYTVPLALLLLFFLPFYRRLILRQEKKMSVVQKSGLAALALILPFNGPLMPALVLVVCPAVLSLLFLKGFRRGAETPLPGRTLLALRSVPKPVWFYFGLISAMSSYSYYIGLFNSENDMSVGLAQRYGLLWPGLREQLFSEYAYPILFGVIALNLWLMRKNPLAQPLLTFYLGLLLFSVVYLSLLPLGGYRPYRALLVRGDTFMPVAMCIFFVYGSSTLHVLRLTNLRFVGAYATALVAVVVILTGADRFDNTVHRCEKEALKAIASSPEPVVRLDTWCGVLEWRAIKEPEHSETASQLLHIWKITDTEKRYTTSP
ncbi:MAG TPA: hypothetical protein VEY71_01725 [Chitinophagales bacterium]|nr:hypothetical protein [Chitinophagales bacterium]